MSAMTLKEWKQTLPPEVAEHFEVIDGRLDELEVPSDLR
jgi:hypothetical protein